MFEYNVVIRNMKKVRPRKQHHHADRKLASSIVLLLHNRKLQRIILQQRLRFYLEERFRRRVVATCQKVQYGVLDLASSYCCFSDIAFNNKILMSFSFFLLFSRCAEMLDMAHDYHLLTLDCSSVCDGAASLTASLTAW